MPAEGEGAWANVSMGAKTVVLSLLLCCGCAALKSHVVGGIRGHATDEWSCTGSLQTCGHAPPMSSLRPRNTIGMLLFEMRGDFNGIDALSLSSVPRHTAAAAEGWGLLILVWWCGVAGCRLLLGSGLRHAALRLCHWCTDDEDCNLIDSENDAKDAVSARVKDHVQRLRGGGRGGMGSVGRQAKGEDLYLLNSLTKRKELLVPLDELGRTLLVYAVSHSLIPISKPPCVL